MFSDYIYKRLLKVTGLSLTEYFQIRAKSKTTGLLLRINAMTIKVVILSLTV